MGISTSEVTDRPAFPGGPGGLPCTVDDVSPPNQLVVYIVIVIGFGLARVGRNVHHPSGVIAVWSLGLLYYVVCMALVPHRPGRYAANAPSSGL